MNKITHKRNVNNVTKEEHTFFKKNILKIDQVKKIDKHKQLYAYKIKNRLFFTHTYKKNNVLYITLLQVQSINSITKVIKVNFENAIKSLAKFYTIRFIYNFIKDWLTT